MDNRKPTLLSVGNFDQLLESLQRYVINRFLQGNSLIFSKFSSNNAISIFFHCSGPKLPKCAKPEKSRTDRKFIGEQCL